MASIDKCYAVAAYNLVSEEHHHSHVMEFGFELSLTMQRLGACYLRYPKRPLHTTRDVHDVMSTRGYRDDISREQMW